ncbi:response regulator [Parashewanella spongiae]|nr:response regulator [Parashewanella spongiae]MCL1077485.1 response regulator [Parashewanella spongiae]
MVAIALFEQWHEFRKRRMGSPVKANAQIVRPKILVIDDTSENLVAMKVLLKNTDTVLLTANSGNEGLALALEDNIALVLLDVNMPQMDGFEVARLLKQLDETSNIPIIFLTANNQDEATRLEGYSSGNGTNLRFS